MNRPDDIRKTVSKTYASAVEQTKATGGSCCAGPAPQGYLTTLAGYSREALASLPADAVANSFGCGNPVGAGRLRRDRNSPEHLHRRGEGVGGHRRRDRVELRDVLQAPLQRGPQARCVQGGHAPGSRHGPDGQGEPRSGHTLRLLSLPHAWSSFIETSTTGTSCLGPLAGLKDQQKLYAASVQALANPERTTLVLVSRLEVSALREAERSSAELRELNVSNQCLVLN